jgi:hypothetical protein
MGTPAEYDFITGPDVSAILKQACCLAYTNDQHYMQLNIALLQSHSFCITAAVALYNVGLSILVIAFRLRSSPESVEHYIRDCFAAVGPLTAKAIAGAYLT